MKIDYNEFGLIIDKKIYSIIQFYIVPDFQQQLVKLVQDSISDITESSVILDNGSEINSVTKTKYKKGMKKINYDKKGLRIRNMLFYLSTFTKNHPELKNSLINLLNNSIKEINNDEIILRSEQTIKPFFNNLYDMIRDVLCFKTLAYCCGVDKPCPNRIRVMNALGISNEEYIKIKEDFEIKFREIAYIKKPEFF